MIGILGRGDRRAAAWKITIYLGLGSLVLLAGALSIPAQAQDSTLTRLVRKYSFPLTQNGPQDPQCAGDARLSHGSSPGVANDASDRARTP